MMTNQFHSPRLPQVMIRFILSNTMLVLKLLNVGSRNWHVFEQRGNQQVIIITVSPLTQAFLKYNAALPHAAAAV